MSADRTSRRDLTNAQLISQDTKDLKLHRNRIEKWVPQPETKIKKIGTTGSDRNLTQFLFSQREKRKHDREN